ncbi:MAG: 30S ribosomal protein S17 [Acidimicrobiia bacterium]|nr:30S ribosomal protein S17 [bacterium]MXX64421.1 30S ribosomal protein S17 [Acidimicrobiia bacterium]MCY3579208.1 30S ribosomal protein S17 [bacterium]MCY3653359.1 30S ribosomal protein S17 [bacterium]MDE0644133.1 30S ribosomal protein S17 [bacterium]
MRARRPAVADRPRRKTRVGVVVSDSRSRTITVQIERRTRHPRYGKIVRSASKVHVHDEENTARNGDRVLIMETRPLSKTKRWRLVEVVGRAR